MLYNGLYWFSQPGKSSVPTTNGQVLQLKITINPFSFLMSVKDSEDSCVLGKTLSIKGADDFNLICELAN
jgi:hypothetical protein